MPPALMMMDRSPVDVLLDTVMMEGIAWVSTTDINFKMLTKIDLFIVSDIILGVGGKHGLNYGVCMGILPFFNLHYKSLKV